MSGAQLPAQVGDYELLDVLGQGGMGVVVRARHRELGVERAIKLMHGDTSEHARLRFEREGSHLARIDHPGVVKVHEARWEGGTSWFVMDLVRGESLEQHLARGLPPLERALELAVAVCEAVGALHQAGVIHRDLKPANVILREDGQPVVIDLGLAIAPEQDQRLTRSGTVMGTFYYMSPEQVDGQRATARSDVWALGLIAFELCTGRRAIPYEDSVPALARRIMGEDRPPPSSFDPDLPAALDEVIGAALSRNPAGRPADGHELAALLREVAASPGPSRRVLRVLRVAVALACLLVVAMGVAVARRVRSAPAGGPRDGSAAPGSGVPEASALDPEAERRAGEELDRIAARPDEERRLSELEGWLEAHGAHPAAKRARALRAALLRKRPWRTLAQEGLLGACWGPPGELFTWGSGGAWRWDVRAARVVQRWSPAGQVLGVAVSPADRAAFLLCCGDGTLLAGRIGEDALQPRGKVPLAGRIPQLHFQLHPDGRRFVLQTGPEQVLLGELLPEGVRELARLEHPSAVCEARFSGDGALVLTGCGCPVDQLHLLAGTPQLALLWDARDGQRRQELATFAQVSGLDLAPGGERLAAATPGNHVHLYDLTLPDPTSDPHPLLGQGRGLVGGVDTAGSAHDITSRRVAFVPGAAWLITTAGDWADEDGERRALGELAVWDVATRRPLLGPLARAGYPLTLELAPKGEWVALGLAPSKAEVWDLSALGAGD